MFKIKLRLTWFMFLLMSWIILIINGTRSKKIHLGFLSELKELFKKNSKYIEDGDYRIVRKRKKKR